MLPVYVSAILPGVMRALEVTWAGVQVQEAGLIRACLQLAASNCLNKAEGPDKRQVLSPRAACTAGQRVPNADCMVLCRSHTGVCERKEPVCVKVEKVRGKSPASANGSDNS
jgi:hypothetical protein